jgi:hypothetical protein
MYRGGKETTVREMCNAGLNVGRVGCCAKCSEIDTDTDHDGKTTLPDGHRR